jgi:hypothetical protein
VHSLTVTHQPDVQQCLDMWPTQRIWTGQADHVWLAGLGWCTAATAQVRSMLQQQCKVLLLNQVGSSTKLPTSAPSSSHLICCSCGVVCCRAKCQDNLPRSTGAPSCRRSLHAATACDNACMHHEYVGRVLIRLLKTRCWTCRAQAVVAQPLP